MISDIAAATRDPRWRSHIDMDLTMAPAADWDKIVSQYKRFMNTHPEQRPFVVPMLSAVASLRGADCIEHAEPTISHLSLVLRLGADRDSVCIVAMEGDRYKVMDVGPGLVFSNRDLVTSDALVETVANHVVRLSRDVDS